MTPNELFALCRSEGDDVDTGFPQDFLWSDAQFTNYLNEALYEASWRVPRLFTPTYTGITSLAINPGVSSYALADNIQYIQWLRLDGATPALKKKTSGNDIRDESGYSDWYTKTGTPLAFWEEIYPHTVNFYPIPVASGTVTFNASTFYPQVTDADLDTALTFPLEYQRGLVHWILHRVYSVKDGQTYDPKLGQVYEDRFTRMFGPRKSAMVMENMRRLRGSDAHSRPSWI